MAEPLRCVVAGLGLGRAWTKIIVESPDFELVGLVELAPKVLEEVASSYDIPQGARYSTFEAALKSAKSDWGADLFVVVTPPASHRENVVAALEAGYHTLSEKPLAATMEEAREMARLIPAITENTGKKYLVSQNYRWTDSVASVKSAIESGLIGSPGYVQLAFNKGFRFGGWRERLSEVLLEDMSIHHFDLLRHLLGKNGRSIYARSFHPDWSWFSGKPAALCVLEMGEGTMISYAGSWVSRGEETTWPGLWRIVGEKGAIHWNGQAAYAVLGSPENASRGEKQERVELPLVQLAQSGFAYSLYEMKAAIDEKREPITGIADNLQSFGITMAAIESARTGGTVDIPNFIKG